MKEQQWGSLMSQRKKRHQTVTHTHTHTHTHTRTCTHTHTHTCYCWFESEHEEIVVLKKINLSADENQISTTMWSIPLNPSTHEQTWLKLSHRTVTLRLIFKLRAPSSRLGLVQLHLLTNPTVSFLLPEPAALNLWTWAHNEPQSPEGWSEAPAGPRSSRNTVGARKRSINLFSELLS